MKEKMSERIGYEGIVEKNVYHKIVGGSCHGYGLYISHVFGYLDEALLEIRVETKHHRLLT
jgi:hypothetical protein